MNAAEVVGACTTYWVYSVSVVMFFERWHELLVRIAAVGYIPCHAP